MDVPAVATKAVDSNGNLNALDPSSKPPNPSIKRQETNATGTSLSHASSRFSPSGVQLAPIDRGTYFPTPESHSYPVRKPSTPSPNTRDILRHFSLILTRKSLQSETPNHVQNIRILRSQRDYLGKLLNQLQHYVDKTESEPSGWNSLLRFFYYNHIGLPNPQQLQELSLHHFPLPGKVKVRVCDFGQGRFETFETLLGNSEYCKLIVCKTKLRGSTC